MIGFGLLLLGIGAGDLAATGLSGLVRDRSRVMAGALTAAVVAGLGGGVAGAPAGSWAAIVALCVATFIAWAELRLAASPGRPPAGPDPLAVLALCVLAGGLATGLAVSGPWQDVDGGALARWLDETPYPIPFAAGPERFTLAVGALAFLTASANGVVRMALLAAGGAAGEPHPQGLRGGRAIGALERTLIFGLAVAGQLGAAALVAAAKAAFLLPGAARRLRGEGPLDPGAGGAPPGAVDYATERFLLGSISSWSLALAAALLF